MSYNIRYDNPNDQKYVWRHRREGVTSNIRFHDPDIVGLQEALHDQLRDLRRRLPKYEWLSAGRRGGKTVGEYAAMGFDRGRFNLEADSTFWLSEDPSATGSVGWDARQPRLVRYARFREYETGIQFYHFNTHFDHVGETSRIQSAALLRNRIDAMTDDLPVIVTGDFNTRESNRAYRRLTRRRQRRTLLDARHAASYPHHGPETTMTDFHRLVPDKKIDYVLVTEDVEVLLHGACADTDGEGLFPSDHLPIVAHVLLPLRRSEER
ncbi:endonuclease/exonuclease/phosphatase family protein [Halobellus sp. GM3]|uniref:endonuclease/exonuclease/phosphatase family protein n=1 Tax=Halobellus sp. GM3 TaxID=3458410 RepID=UPI00403DDEFA